MTEHQESRTLVKSPPELWAECSEPSSLARHLDQFGEIRITRLEPETAVAWEGEHVSGTVRLESSGWGTKVILTARPAPPAKEAPAPAAVEAREPDAPSPPAPPQPGVGAATRPALGTPRRRGGMLGTLRRAFGFDAQPPASREISPPPLLPQPRRPPDAVRQQNPAPACEPDPVTPGLLTAALDSLGQAHHRPFSRG
ncbi:MAG: hypothetical protein ACYC91_12790 [Solirubrobacteraceae bacterium]